MKRLLPAFLFLGLFFFLPLARILALGLNPGQFGLLGGAVWLRLLEVLRFTVFQALASTFLTLLLGLPLAFLFAHYTFPLKPLLRTITAIPFMLPTIVVAAGFNALLGPRGWLNLGLTALDLPPIEFIGTLTAILTAHVFYNTGIVIRMVGAAWAALDPRLEQAARSLGAHPVQVFLRITLPLLRPSILAAAALIFLFDFTSYGVILLLGGPRFATLEVEIYLQAMHFLNLPTAAMLALTQLVCTLGLSVLYSRYITRLAVPVKPVERILQAPQTALQRTFVFLAFSFILLFFLLPMLALPLRSVSRLEPARGQRTTIAPALTLEYYQELFINRRGSVFYIPPINAARNSLTYASLTVLISLTLGFPAAMALSRPGKFARLSDPLLMLPLGASAVTLGLGYIVTFNHPLASFLPSALTKLGAFSSLVTDSLLKSPLLIPLAHTTIALPFVIRNLQAALATIPNRYREAAAVLGASPAQVWWYIDRPILSRAVISSSAFAFTVSLGEFGAASLLARPEYPTLPTAIFRFLSQPGGMNYGQAMAMATLLMLLTGLSIWLIERERVTREL
ncbi:MAG: iron ABC transporter permease [Anaerolineae bacterium]|nr:MAG: iron ABC transporter permease [Anaerolineae bacterium]